MAATHNIRRSGHSLQLAALNINGKGNHRSNERSKLENRPKHRECFSFVLFKGIAHHDFTLGGPEEGSGYSEECTGHDEEPRRALRLVTVTRD